MRRLFGIAALLFATIGPIVAQEAAAGNAEARAFATTQISDAERGKLDFLFERGAVRFVEEQRRRAEDVLHHRQPGAAGANVDGFFIQSS